MFHEDRMICGEASAFIEMNPVEFDSNVLRRIWDILSQR